MRRPEKSCPGIAALSLVLGLAAAAQASYIPVYGTPAYDPATGTGMKSGYGTAVNDAGTAVGYADKYASGTLIGPRAVRWDASGTAATELGNLGTRPSGFTDAWARAINDAGTAVGYADKYVGGTFFGQRAVRWDASGTAATELGNLGMDASGTTWCDALAINDAGTTVGKARKYVGGTYVGERAVRWDASGTAATELGNLGTDASGGTGAEANAINDAGTAVGYAIKYIGGTLVGERAVRWDASGTAATELGNLGTGPSGGTYSFALAINHAGTAVGYAAKFVVGTLLDQRAVRWDASGTAATELGNLGTDASGRTHSEAFAINDAGTAVGWARKCIGVTYKGLRAVRWDASGTAATELGNLGTDASGNARCSALAINGAGTAVGWAEKYIGGVYQGHRAICWGLDGAAVDLNDLIDPASGWVLAGASAISDTGWITGHGQFDPDGTGPLAAYTRGFLIQVPEPATLALLALGAAGLLVRRRRAGPGR